MMSVLSRPPFVGLSAFLVVLILQALGHTVMILMEKYLGETYIYHSAAIMGLGGAALTFWGVRLNHKENAATWLGFLGGMFLWTGWVEFSFVFYSRHLGVPHLMENGEIVTKAEYLVMPSSLGVFLATLVFFAFNRETRCNAFRWLHRVLRIPVGRPTVGFKRNIAAIVAMETVYLIWFSYVLLLVLYDERILGEGHWVMYPILFGYIVWSLYLLNRLRKFTRLASALRYGIPTAIIGWTVVEILGHWDLFTEFWVHPEDYAIEMTVMLGALATLAVIMARLPASARIPDEDPEAQAISASQARAR